MRERSNWAQQEIAAIEKRQEGVAKDREGLSRVPSMNENEEPPKDMENIVVNPNRDPAKNNNTATPDIERQAQRSDVPEGARMRMEQNFRVKEATGSAYNSPMASPQNSPPNSRPGSRQGGARPTLMIRGSTGFLSQDLMPIKSAPEGVQPPEKGN